MSFSDLVHSRCALRITAVLFSLAGLLFLSGCWVKSINGLNEADFLGSDKDKVYDPTLLGSWTVTDDNCVTTLKITAEGKEYHWETKSAGEGCDNGQKATLEFDGELFKLGGHQFLDLTPRSEDVCGACLAVHWIFLLRNDNGTLQLSPIDSDWLEKAEKEKTVRLATVHGDPDTITASPKELKEFCRTYADDETVFKPDPDILFKKN